MWRIIAVYEKEFSKNCELSCPFECFSIDYITTSSRQLYPPKYRLDQLLYKFNYFQLISDKQFSKEAFLKFNVYYQGMQYMSTEQLVAMNLQDLISGYGGTLGFFLGIIY
jgi:hypothetical protein